VKRTRYFIGIGLGVLIGTDTAVAGESVVLTTGYAIHVDRHEVEGDRVRLYSGAGVTELLSARVARFEADPVVAAAVAVTGPTPATEPVEVTRPLLADPAAEAAQKAALPEAFVRSVMKAESNFVPTALSPKGAIGLMQLMPETAAYLGVDPRDPHQNAEGGARYLRELLEKYQDDPNQVLLALAAYNAGPRAVEKYRGVPPFTETRPYILRVLKEWKAADSATGVER